jgi:hypothetical protein
MALWSEYGRAIPAVDVFSWRHEPQTDTQRTDAIMRILSERPFSRATPANSWATLSWPQPMSANMNPAQFGRVPAWEEELTGSKAGLQYLSDGRSVQLASAGAVPAVVLRMGQAGFAALRGLGAAAAAALAAVLQSYQNRLGRLPTPDELDAAIREAAKSQGTSVARDRPGAPEDKQECEDQLKIESAICSEVAKKHGNMEGAICGKTAMERYQECLRYGPGGVRTPLYRPTVSE